VIHNSSPAKNDQSPSRHRDGSADRSRSPAERRRSRSTGEQPRDDEINNDNDGQDSAAE